jgi:hypothetical protein
VFAPCSEPGGVAVIELSARRERHACAIGHQRLTREARIAAPFVAHRNENAHRTGLLVGRMAGLWSVYVQSAGHRADEWLNAGARPHLIRRDDFPKNKVVHGVRVPPRQPQERTRSTR